MSLYKTHWKQKSSSHSKQLPTEQPPQEGDNQTPTSSKKSTLPTPVPAGKGKLNTIPNAT